MNSQNTFGLLKHFNLRPTHELSYIACQSAKLNIDLMLDKKAKMCVCLSQGISYLLHLSELKQQNKKQVLVKQNN